MLLKTPLDAVVVLTLTMCKVHFYFEINFQLLKLYGEKSGEYEWKSLSLRNNLQVSHRGKSGTANESCNECAEKWKNFLNRNKVAETKLLWIK